MSGAGRGGGEGAGVERGELWWRRGEVARWWGSRSRQREAMGSVPVTNPRPAARHSSCSAPLQLGIQSATRSTHRRWPTCISFATFGEEKSTTTRLPSYPLGAQLAMPLRSMLRAAGAGAGAGAGASSGIV